LTPYHSDQKYGGVEHGARGVRPLLGGVGPVLRPCTAAPARVHPTADVSRGGHAGRSGGQVGGAEDAVVDVESGACDPLGVRLHADARDDHIGRQGGPVAEPENRGVAVLVDPVHRDTGAQGRAVPGVQSAEQRTDLVADCAGQGRTHGLEDGDLQTLGSGGGGDLGPDESGTDDHDRPGLVERPPQSQAIGVGAQHVHGGVVVSAGQVADTTASGEHQGVVPDVAVGGRHDALGRVQPGGPDAES
jgi:hypothetical protein